MFNFESFRRTSSSPSVPTTNDKTNGASDDSGRPGFLQRMASTENVNRTTQSTSTRSNLGNGPKNSASSTFSSILSSSSSIPVPVNSWAMLTLSRLQDTEGEFDDIVDLLLTENRSVLLLPVSRPSHPFIIIDREFIHDHVIVYQNSDMSQGNSLSGIRGIFQKDKFIALGIVPPGRQLMPISNDKQGLDNFHLDTSSIASDQPTYPILASHVQIPIKDKQINVMLIQKPISRTDVIEWDSREINQVEPILSNGLANALADAFVKRYRKNMPRTLDQASATILDFLEDVRSSLLQSGVSSDEIEDRLDEVESYLCNALYECLFPHPGGDESMADEALESRIAALNLLDLNLEHLGVLVSDESEIESIDAVVKTAGIQLQKLNSIMGAKEKMEALVMTHHIIVSAMESFAEKYKQTKLDTIESRQDQEVQPDEDTLIDDDEKELVLDPHVENDPKDEDQAIKLKEDQPVAAKPKENGETKEKEKESDNQNLHSASADVLLPLLIFTIVKSNPTNFLSNLRFIQRYRRPSQMTGQASYCLTNMMAAVSFLETTNLVGLGLSADRVYSHVTDLNGSGDSSLAAATHARPAASAGGLKIMSDVVDSSYRVLDGIGRLWQRTAESEPLANPKQLKPPPLVKNGPNKSILGTSASMMEEMVGRVRQVSDASEKKQTLSELKDMAHGALNSRKQSMSSSNHQTSSAGGAGWENAVPSFMESRAGTFKPTRSETIQALLQAPSNFIQSVTPKPSSSSSSRSKEGPLKKFLEVKSVDELKIGEVAELLADYKRLAAILKQANYS